MFPSDCTVVCLLVGWWYSASTNNNNIRAGSWLHYGLFPCRWWYSRAASNDNDYVSSVCSGPGPADCTVVFLFVRWRYLPSTTATNKDSARSLWSRPGPSDHAVFFCFAGWWYFLSAAAGAARPHVIRWRWCESLGEWPASSLWTSGSSVDLMTGQFLSTPGMIVRSLPLALTLHRLLFCPLWMSSGISFVCVWVI